MAGPARPESSVLNADEERLAHALISRGLVTREEYQQCRVVDGAAAETGKTGPEALLVRLVKAGFLTTPQARRALQELTQLLKEQIPGYQLVEKLGQGSMGTVFKARQLSMNRLVAIKILQPRLAANQEFLERFTREAHLAARFSSNNVVQAIDVGSAGTLHYFIMEFVEGTTIRHLLDQGKRFTEREALEIIVQIAQALEHAHRRGLIHRDVKPANIILTPDGIAKLADLGLARETADRALARAEKGMMIGTPYYISPEQIQGREDVDIRADIYALGATLYHMVTGQPPFPGKTSQAVLDAHLMQELTPPDHLVTTLSAGLGEVVEFMMAKDRRQRYRTPADLIIDLECLLNEEPPKLARQRLEAASLARLAEGEEDDGEPEVRPFLQRSLPVLWFVIGAASLAVSLLLNLVLFLR
jgi:serine/threonine-protein kinase